MRIQIAVLIFCVVVASASVAEWPEGADPAMVSTRVARQFLSADPLNYRPEGFRGSGYFAERQWEKPGPRDAYPWYFELPPLEERMAWWEKGYSAQTRLWIDDMYMITFLQTQAYRITGERRFVV